MRNFLHRELKKIYFKTISFSSKFDIDSFKILTNLISSKDARKLHGVTKYYHLGQ